MQQVHAALEAAHALIIALLKPGLPVAEYGKHVDDIMQQALLELGLIKTKDDRSLSYLFSPRSQPWFGVDVHDSLGGPALLAAWHGAYGGARHIYRQRGDWHAD